MMPTNPIKEEITTEQLLRGMLLLGCDYIDQLIKSSPGTSARAAAIVALNDWNRKVREVLDA